MTRLICLYTHVRAGGLVASGRTQVGSVRFLSLLLLQSGEASKQPVIAYWHLGAARLLKVHGGKALELNQQPSYRVYLQNWNHCIFLLYVLNEVQISVT